MRQDHESQIRDARAAEPLTPCRAQRAECEARSSAATAGVLVSDSLTIEGLRLFVLQLSIYDSHCQQALANRAFIPIASGSRAIKWSTRFQVSDQSNDRRHHP